MRDSIKRQITILSVGIVAFTMIIALLINGRFMEVITLQTRKRT